MKQKLRNIKFKMQALWCLLTHKRFYLVVYNGRQAHETGNIDPQTVVWLIQYIHGSQSYSDIAKGLIEQLKEQQ